jgi:hypothetical protein
MNPASAGVKNMKVMDAIPQSARDSAAPVCVDEF